MQLYSRSIGYTNFQVCPSLVKSELFMYSVEKRRFNALEIRQNQYFCELINLCVLVFVRICFLCGIFVFGMNVIVSVWNLSKNFVDKWLISLRNEIDKDYSQIRKWTLKRRFASTNRFFIENISDLWWVYIKIGIDTASSELPTVQRIWAMKQPSRKPLFAIQIV